MKTVFQTTIFQPICSFSECNSWSLSSKSVFFTRKFFQQVRTWIFQVTCLRENLPLFFPSKKSSATPKRPIFETDFRKITGIYESTKTSQKTKIRFSPWKFNSSPLKISHSKRNVIFQPSFFRGYVKLRGCFFGGLEIISPRRVGIRVGPI